MSELRELYQEVILDHYKNPRNQRRPSGTSHDAHGYNPLCGDKLTVYLELDDSTLKDAGFEGSGCAISVAAASLMTEAVKGRTRAEVEALFSAYHKLLTGTGEAGEAGEAAASLGKLAVLSGVREFPVRVKCATLAWHTLKAALESKAQTVSTE